MAGYEEGHISELVAPYVLGALEPDEVEQVETHLDQCPMCRELVEEQRQVVTLMPYLAEPHSVPLHAREQLLARVQEESGQSPQSRAHRLKVFLLPSGRAGWMAAATAAVLALVFAVNSFQMQGEMEKQAEEASEERANIAEMVQSPGGWMTSLEGGSSGAGGGIIVDPTTNRAIMVVDGLDQPSDDHEYVVWMVDEANGDHINAGELVVDEDGRGQLYITSSGALANYDGMLITEEVDQETVAGPTGNQVMAATFE
ncbi:MAG: anti-sigma factor [Thermomicrobiaceae bacterium]